MKGHPAHLKKGKKEELPTTCDSFFRFINPGIYLSPLRNKNISFL
jgi:hypothetical protein